MNIDENVIIINGQSVELLEDNSNDAKEQPTMLSRTSKVTRYIAIFTYFFIVCVTFFLVTFYQPTKEFIYDWIKSMLELGPLGYALLALFGILNSLFCLPISLYELLLGFTLRDFAAAYIIDCIQNFISPTIQYFLVKYLLRDRFLRRLQNTKAFKVFRKMIERDIIIIAPKIQLQNQKILTIRTPLSQQAQECGKQDDFHLHQDQNDNQNQSPIHYTNYKNIFLIQLMYIPLFLKNYSIPLFNVSYSTFILTQLPVTYAFGACQIYIGFSASNFQYLLEDDDGSSQFLFIFVIVMTVLITIYLIRFSRMKIKEIGLEDDAQIGITEFESYIYDDVQPQNVAISSSNNAKIQMQKIDNNEIYKHI